MDCSKLFDPYLQTWGFSGDIVFWSFLKEHFAARACIESLKQIDSEADLRADIEEMFSSVSGGQRLADGGLVECSCVSLTRKDGNETVTINAAWWTHTGIPMLCKRFRREKLREHYRKIAEEGDNTYDS